ncbi:DUF1642 domain-containing protein [Lacticaseibacillus styriensis]|jgi:hypothetical protein|uniref:DUF1642 domain-containing protein n=2 Tax=Lacticaseibacillus TaxID=2759736 RepID=A0AAN1C7K0_LACCA|nr:MULTISPECIES: DUF1642 domain-containing protein [Lacticaseibacillus]ARY90940.1 hypothetical protein BGL52_03950 [Lacticaseibacillus casei]EPC24533.1 hypothetical protein Lpp46_2567 [Lacticaseibacillus paracasei subsp. paracasei Lpp46]WLV81552.1 DUF1642 domain-containing protein [Lacticaseibacillus sp. NCIMB 15473]
MSEEKLYAIKNDYGEWADSHYTFGTGAWATPYKAKREEDAKHHGGHVVALVEEPKKVVLSEERAQIVEDANKYKFPASYISMNTDDYDGLEKLLMEAFVNGYTVKSDKKYLVYKELGGKQKHEQFAQAYRSSVYPGTVRWILTNEVINRSFAQFAESEIEHYGLQNCECVEAKE